MTRLARRYELGAPIGSGGTADVIEAFDHQLQRPVAVKMLRTELPDPRARERFEREARVAAGFTHPNAIHVYDVGEADRRPYIVMERVQGPSLAEVIAERGTFAPDQAVDISDQVLAALEAAHRRGLVHRDVKPGNVMLADDGNVKLTDFGIAKAISDSTSALTATGLVMGTPRYLSPEQAAGQPADPRSDLYAVGVVLYEMLAGEPPFVADTPMAMALAHQQAPVPPLAQRRPGLPPALLATVDRALEKDPARRFQDAAAMRTALAGDGGAAPSAVTVPAAAVGATEVLPRTTRRSAPPPRRRRGWLVVAALLGLFLVAALVAWAIADRDDPNDPTDDTDATTQETEPSTTAPTTTLPPEPPTPQTIDELIALLSDDPESFGQSGPELLDALINVTQGDEEEQAERAADLLGDLEEWVEDDEIDPEIAGVAQGILIPIAAQGDGDQGNGNGNGDGNDGNGGPPGGGNGGGGNGNGDD